MTNDAEKALRRYIIADCLVTFTVFITSSLFFAKLTLELFAFWMFEAMDLLDTFETQASKLRELAGCQFQPILTLCVKEYLQTHPDELRAFHISISTDLPILYEFPANAAGLILCIVAFATSALAFKTVGLTARSTLLKSNLKLISQIPAVIAFSATLRESFGSNMVVTNGIRRPRTINRTVYVPIAYFLEWRAAGQISPSMTHSLWHEVAHAKLLYPYEGLLFSLRSSYLLLFGVALVPVVIGLVVGPLLLASTAITARARHRILEWAADRYADRMLGEPTSRKVGSKIVLPGFISLVGILSFGTTACLLGLEFILNQTLWGGYVYLVPILSILVAILILNWIWRYAIMTITLFKYEDV